MNKYESIKTSKLLDLLTDPPDDEIGDILEEIGKRSPFGYNDERIGELEGKIETLEAVFKKHFHSGGKLCAELK